MSADKEARTLTIEDNGVGMSRTDLIDNLGRIANSGTANFLNNLGKDADLSLIGQFGVGFYSAFLVADTVEVVSRSFREPEQTWKWMSSGGSFTVEEASQEELFGERSGTKMIIHLKDEAEEYMESRKLSELLVKYSEFITFPIEVWAEKVVHEEVADESAEDGEPCDCVCRSVAQPSERRC